MEALLLGIYSFFVWLVFFKFKWLPWNTTSQVIVITLPIIGLTALILLLNVFAPSSHDVRVLKYVVNVVPQVKGRVLEVPAEGNRPMKKGDVLFTIDPTPYQLQVASLEAQLANAQGGGRELDEQLTGAIAQVAAAKSSIQQATSRVGQAGAQQELAAKRVAQNRELVARGAGNRFDLEQAETNLREAEGALDGARSAEAQARSAEGQALAAERQIRQRMGAKASSGELAQVAQVRAQLESAKWDLSQTTVLAPANGTPVNLQLRPGSMTAAFPALPVLTFVEDEFTVIAIFHQNELHQVRPGDEAEIALLTNPGEIIKAQVDSIIWAQGQGSIQAGLALPQTTAVAPGSFPVKLKVDPRHKDLFLAAGARGQAAIYTEHLGAIHILRKVILRVGTKINYLILKLH
ncbi:MAG TPA: biotin/lipoyl-binding protein [Usitatibacter sp.]|jgi:multidrug resistance efflux pump|nr:biotin/lipoyl-binding protein [Usitatibacter sp.]